MSLLISDSQIAHVGKNLFLANYESNELQYIYHGEAIDRQINNENINIKENSDIKKIDELNLHLYQDEKSPIIEETLIFEGSGYLSTKNFAYNGGWLNHKFHGSGVIEFASGLALECIFDNGHIGKGPITVWYDKIELIVGESDGNTITVDEKKYLLYNASRGINSDDLFTKKNSTPIEKSELAIRDKIKSTKLDCLSYLANMLQGQHLIEINKLVHFMFTGKDISDSDDLVLPSVSNEVLKYISEKEIQWQPTPIIPMTSFWFCKPDFRSCIQVSVNELLKDPVEFLSETIKAKNKVAIVADAFLSKNEFLTASILLSIYTSSIWLSSIVDDKNIVELISEEIWNCRATKTALVIVIDCDLSKELLEILTHLTVAQNNIPQVVTVVEDQLWPIDTEDMSNTQSDNETLKSNFTEGESIDIETNFSNSRSESLGEKEPLNNSIRVSERGYLDYTTSKTRLTEIASDVLKSSEATIIFVATYTESKTAAQLTVLGVEQLYII